MLETKTSRPTVFAVVKYEIVLNTPTLRRVTSTDVLYACFPAAVRVRVCVCTQTVRSSKRCQSLLRKTVMPLHRPLFSVVIPYRPSPSSAVCPPLLVRRSVRVGRGPTRKLALHAPHPADLGVRVTADGYAGLYFISFLHPIAETENNKINKYLKKKTYAHDFSVRMR